VKSKRASAVRNGDFGKGIQRTDALAINPQSLSDKTVYLVHPIHSGLRPAFLCYDSFDLLTEGFHMFWMGDETIQNVRERLRVSNNQVCVMENKITSLT